MARKTVRQRSLFGGYTPEPRDPRGRKRIAWSQQVAEKVATLAALKRTQEEIAADVGLSVKTLARIYADELESARELIRQAVFETQLRQAVDKGSTSAAKFVVAQLDRELLEEAAYRPRHERRSPPKLGKKEERQRDAEAVVNTIFAPGAPPAKLAH